MPTSSMAIVAFPHVYGTALGKLFAQRGYEVDVFDVMNEDWLPSSRYDVVVTNLPLPDEGQFLRVDLPDDFTAPVTASIGDLRVAVTVDSEEPVVKVLDLVDRLLGGTDVTAVERLAELREGAAPFSG